MSHLFVLRLLYAAAMIGAAVALFGAPGIIVGALIAGFWALVFYRPPLMTALLAMCLSAFFLLCILPAPPSRAREPAWRAICKNHLKQIMLAMHNYHEEYGSFPPAYVADKEGRPMHSWRVLLLPYVDQQALYRTYRFDEPWDSEANREALARTPFPYACPSHNSSHDGMTSYVAVVGPQTGWIGTRGRTTDEFADGTASTVLIIEHDSNDIQWTEPRDIDLATATQLFDLSDAASTGTHSRRNFFFEYQATRNLALADGSVRSAPLGLRPDFARSLFVIDDGGPAGDWDLNRETTAPYRRLRIGNVVRLAAFVIFALLPLPWVWRKPRMREAAA